MEGYVPTRYSSDVLTKRQHSRGFSETFRQRESMVSQSRASSRSGSFVTVNNSVEELKTVGIVESKREPYRWAYVPMKQINKPPKRPTRPKHLSLFDVANAVDKYKDRKHRIEESNPDLYTRRVTSAMKYYKDQGVPEEQEKRKKSIERPKKQKQFLAASPTYTYRQLYAMEHPDKKKEKSLVNQLLDENESISLTDLLSATITDLPEDAKNKGVDYDKETKAEPQKEHKSFFKPEKLEDLQEESKKSKGKTDGIKKEERGKSQVRFTKSDLVLKSEVRVSELLGFSAPLNTSTSILSTTLQSLSFIREKPSSDKATIIDVTENIVVLEASHKIQVTPSNSSFEQKWEVEPGFAIFKTLNPIAYSPSKTKAQSSDEGRLRQSLDRENVEKIHGDIEECTEFVGPIEAAKLVISSTIETAKERFCDLIFQYGASNKQMSKMKLPRVMNYNYWSSIKEITKEEGIFLVERYIIVNSELRDNWKYTIFFQGAQSDKVSDHYFYEVNFSLPSKLYPVAQVTASLYFHMEASRVIPPECPIQVRYQIEGSRLMLNPERFVLRDDILYRVLDTKIKLFQEVTF